MKIGKKDKIFKIKRSSKKSDFTPVLVMIGAAALLSLPIAVIWQKIDTPMEKQTTPQYILDRELKEKQDKGSVQSSDGASNGSSEEASQSNNVSATPVSDAAVPKGEWVESSYFDDAVFVGDSLSVGIDNYEVMTNAHVLAAEGLNPQTILTSTAVKNKNGDEVKVLDALKELNPGKIYIMLGSNGFFWMERDMFMKYYTEFLTQLKQQHPDAIIYVQSIMPVTKKKEESDERFKNSIINEYNADIIKMCEELDVNYVNCAEALMQEDGTLPMEASPNDGMHFNATYYRKWMDYLRNHTV